MATITGTHGDDRLTGTAQADTMISLSGDDTLLGRGGDDTYQLDFQSMAQTARSFLINETYGGDGSADTITGLGGLMLYQFGGIEDFTRFSRAGADGANLLVTTASSPSWYNHVGYASGDIRIINQYGPTTPHAQIETLVAGGTSYNLLNSDTGTTGADILTGWSLSDTLTGDDGGDYISGGRGRDYLYGDAGADTIFGDQGSDLIYGGLDGDHIFGEAHNDRAWGGDGNDSMYGGTGRDLLRGDNGDDFLSGDEANDRLVGGFGTDTLAGGTGDDSLYGGANRDIYRIDTTMVQHDHIIENGRAPDATLGGYSNYERDVIEVLGFSNYDEAIHNIGLQVSGNDLIITYTNPAMAVGDVSSITIEGQFASARNTVELVSFGEAGGLAGYLGTQAHHIAQLSGDNFTYSVHSYSDWGGEDIVLGTSGGDEIYGGLANDILSGQGGADVFMFHDEELNSAGHDIILDFDVANDLIDVSEIAGLSYAGITVTDNAWGNAVASSAFFNIELAGVAAAEVTAGLFVF